MIDSLEFDLGNKVRILVMIQNIRSLDEDFMNQYKFLMESNKKVVEKFTEESLGLAEYSFLLNFECNI